MSFAEIISTILPGNSQITFNENGSFNTFLHMRQVEGNPGQLRLHGGVDIKYPGASGNPLNIAGASNVWSPVGGKVVFVGGSKGGVVIQAADGTFHQILHLDSRVVELGQTISEGSLLGQMGATGADGVVHVHYSIYLPDDTGGVNSATKWDSSDQKIDPEVYWNHAPGEPGLKVILQPLLDDVIREGEAQKFVVRINTPHTKAMELRVTLTAAQADKIEIFGGKRDATNPNVIYLTIPPTVNAEQMNLSAHFWVYGLDDEDAANETGTLSIEAGYRRANGTWVSFQNFEKVTNTAIEIIDAGVAAPPETTRTIVGDLAPIDVDPVEAGMQYGHDELGNVLVDPEQPEPNRVDVLYDSAGNDDIRGLGGDDRIYALRGGDDRLDGGAGSDILAGYAGNDILIGGEGMDVLSAGTGRDYLYAGNEVTLTVAMAANNGTGSGLKGDYLNGGEGDDLLVGEVGNDALNGGAGDDLIVGGGGDDDIRGDFEASNVLRGWSRQRSEVTDANGVKLYTTSYDGVAGLAFSYVVPAGAFADPDAGETLTYSVKMQDGSALPAWLVFDAQTRRFSGIPNTLGPSSDTRCYTRAHGTTQRMRLAVSKPPRTSRYLSGSHEQGMCISRKSIGMSG